MTPTELARQAAGMLTPTPAEGIENFAIRLHEEFEQVVWSLTNREPRPWRDLTVRQQAGLLSVARRKIRLLHAPRKARPNVRFTKPKGKAMAKLPDRHYRPRSDD